MTTTEGGRPPAGSREPAGADDTALGPQPSAPANLSPAETQAVEEWRKEARELEGQKDLSDWAPTAAVDGAGLSENPLSVLSSIMQATLFADLFCRWSVRRCEGETLPQAVSQMVELHPFYYRACRWADFLLRAVIVFLVLVVVFGAAVGLVLQTWYPSLLSGGE